MSLRTFSLRIFQHCPLTAHCDLDMLEKAYAHWIGYKKRIPVRGAILLNEAMDYVLLVRGWNKGSAWMFPRGKINQGEDDLDCAVREVYEETGFNAMAAGLIPEDRNVHHVEMSMKDQHVKLFVIPGVPMDFHFEPRTRKEIGDIRWYKLVDLPGRAKKKQGQDPGTAVPNTIKSFMVASFSDQLNRWIKQQLKRRDRMRHAVRNGHLSQVEVDDGMTEEEGMAAEAAAEPPPVFATAESHEAATKELHRLLKIQPPTQRSQAGTVGLEQDKGKALLAMLHQKHAVPSQTLLTAQNTHVSHTPMDHVYNVAPQPHTPQHRRPTQMLAPDNVQAPPPFPIQPDITNQLRSILGVGTAVKLPEQTTQQQAQMSNQQLAMMMASNAANQPALAHPQPLPRQANHILTGATVPTASLPDNRNVQMQQQTNMTGSLHPGMSLPQQLVASRGQQPAVLDNNRLALLNAFKKGPSPPKEQVVKGPSPLPSVAGSQRPYQQQPLGSGQLGSPYAGQRSAIPVQHGPQNQLMPPHGSPQLPVPQTNLRPTNVSPLQQKALLDIFKKQPSALSPRRDDSRPNSKENGTPYLPSPGNVQQQLSPGFNTGPVALPSVHQGNDGISQAHTISNPTYGAQNFAMRPKNGDQRGLQQSLPSQSGVQLLSAFMGGAGAENRVKMMSSPGRVSQNPPMGGSPYSNPAQINPSMGGSPYSNPAQIGLVTPPANLVPRRQDDPQQLQTLMSLFKGPAATGPASPLANAGAVLKGKEPALFHSGRFPTPGSRVGSMGPSPGGLDGAGGAGSMSRRSSQQAPISPENEKFLLNYLKTVSGSAK